MAGLFQRIAQNYRKKKKITQSSARLNAKEDKHNTQEKWCVLRKGYIVKWKKKIFY